VTEYVIRTRQGLLLNTSVADFVSANGLMPPQGPLARSFLGVPMLAGEHVIGMIGAQDSERRGAFRAEHLELLSSVAAQAAAALDNARLVESLRSELAERALAEARLEQQAHEMSSRLTNSARFTAPRPVCSNRERALPKRVRSSPPC